MSIKQYTEAELLGMSDKAIAEYRSALAETLRFMSVEDRKPYMYEFDILDRVQKDRLERGKK